MKKLRRNDLKRISGGVSTSLTECDIDMNCPTGLCCSTGYICRDPKRYPCM